MYNENRNLSDQVTELNNKTEIIDISSAFSYPASVSGFHACKIGHTVRINCLITNTTKQTIEISSALYKSRYSYDVMVPNYSGWTYNLQMFVGAAIYTNGIIRIPPGDFAYTKVDLEYVTAN